MMWLNRLCCLHSSFDGICAAKVRSAINQTSYASAMSVAIKMIVLYVFPSTFIDGINTTAKPSIHNSGNFNATQGTPMPALQQLLTSYREAAKTEREKGTYFEELICTYFRNEATYRDLYSQVVPYADWAREQDLDARDTGIDLVAKTHGTGEYHAIQCKGGFKSEVQHQKIQ
jgi:Restriction endonuclease